MDPESTPESGGEPTTVSDKLCRFNPWIFFGLLAVPGVLSIIVLSQDDSNYGEKALMTLIVSSIIAGLICGVHFTLAQRSMAIGLKILIGIVSVVGCAGAAFALGMGGCFLIGNLMNVL